MRLLFLLSKHGPSPMSRIAEWLGVGLPTASGAVERVERHGLVDRQHRLDDRRVVECRLTDAGRRLIDEISGMRLEMMRQFLGVLDRRRAGRDGPPDRHRHGRASEGEDGVNVPAEARVVITGGACQPD